MNEIVRMIIESLLGGTLIVTLVTLRSTRRKAREDVRAAAIENDKALMNSFNEFIVEPLKREVNALRKDVRRFTRAVEKINDCPHAADCPVRHELQNSKDSNADDSQDGAER